ncbi:MAG: precorrin-6y C5,15-methyltransferase (decarboxylating) subunit CbiE [Synergistaceae bacterium]|jgi:precorrin-6y C5,15-methyltransferase (decarboxylating) CbiE subunit|nr:precorrin-6y C5,15-methyltransferase (decarboxylating) subunit CbiE [Synergistaceae bacterium]
MIRVVGMGPGVPRYMTDEATDALSAARVIIAGKKMLEAAAPLSRARMVELPQSGMSDEVVGVLERESRGGDVVLAVSGDPGFYSFAKKVIARFGRDNVTTVPGLASIQLLAARIGRSWVNVASEALYGRELPERRALAERLACSAALVVMLGPAHDAISHIRWLAEDEALSGMWAAVGWNLGLPGELVFEAESLADLARCPYAGDLGTLWLERH